MPRPWGLLGLALVVGGCGDDRGPTALDVADLVANYGDVIDSDGTVLAVSRQGRVLRTGATGEVCVVEADNTTIACWAVDVPLEASTVAWSPDGSLVAFDGLVNRQRLLDSDVQVLDVETGDVVTLADDGSDDAAGPQDLLPAWIDDDEVAFLRAPGEAAVGGTAQVVFAQLDGDVTAVDAADLELRAIAAPTAATLDGRYVVTVGWDDAAELVGVDDEGGVRTIVDVDDGVAVTGTSRDGHQAVLVAAGLFSVELRPVVHLAGDDSTPSTFTSRAAALSPDGAVVAAFAAGALDGSGRDAITLWDPTSGAARRLEPGERDPTVAGVKAVTWTDDHRLVVWSSRQWQVVTLDDGG